MLATASLTGLAVLADPSWRWPGFGLVILAWLTWTGLAVAVPRLGFFLPVVHRGRAGNRTVALTFDDGPDPQATPAVLDALARHQVSAAFFVVGSRVEAHPDLVKRMDREGHLVGNHSFRHAWWTNFLWGNRLRREVVGTQEAVAAVIGRRPAFYRPPMGLTNPHLAGILRETGLTCLAWDVRTFDTGSPPHRVHKRIAKQVRDGSIILLHDRGRDPEGAAGLVNDAIALLQGQGYRLDRLDRLIGLPAYQGEQP